jgi:hypothetical protein
MRKLLLIMLLIQCAAAADAQTFKEWFRQKKTQKEYLIAQIAALNVYKEYLEKGYEIAKDGLTLIGDIKDGDFKMHKAYFSSLKSVSLPVKNYGRVKDIIDVNSKVYYAYRSYPYQAAQSGMFTQEEIAYIGRVFVRLMIDCSALKDEADRIMKPGVLVMKDDERIRRIDEIHAKLQQNYTFCKGFGNSVLVLAASRKKDITSGQKMEAILDTK